MALLLVVLTLGVAFANGANDVSKGVATLVGGGLASERRAILWGAGWTVLGGAAALGLSRGMLSTLAGPGIWRGPPLGEALPLAAAAGVIGWLALATGTGLPVSTTHSLVGAILGAGLVAAGGGDGVVWSGVLAQVALPLALSPILSLALVGAGLPVAGAGFRRLGRYCVCLEQHEPALAPAGPGGALSTGRAFRMLAGADCPPRVVTRINALDSLHWLAAGATSFARGLNDAPKILALGLLAGAGIGLGTHFLLVLVAVAMGLGGCYAGARVTGTLSRKVTPMSGPDALTASGVTAVLVGLASGLGLPVSTTHVAGGSVIAVGIHRRELRGTIARDMAIAWLVTVPITAALAAGVYAVAVR